MLFRSRLVGERRSPAYFVRLVQPFSPPKMRGAVGSALFPPSAPGVALSWIWPSPPSKRKRATASADPCEHLKDVLIELFDTCVGSVAWRNSNGMEARNSSMSVGRLRTSSSSIDFLRKPLVGSASGYFGFILVSRNSISSARACATEMLATAVGLLHTCQIGGAQPDPIWFQPTVGNVGEGCGSGRFSPLLFPRRDQSVERSANPLKLSVWVAEPVCRPDPEDVPAKILRIS